MIAKNIFDRVFALIGLIILSPLILVIYLINKVMTPGNPFIYKQERIGQYGKPFMIYKIRTMYDNAEEQGTISTYGDPRVTPFGRWLRETKLDTILELINVIKGDMSIVGPRPDVPGYADKLQGEDRKILELKPGITGPASIKYRHEDKILAQQKDPKRYNDEIIYPDKVKINLEYYEKRSFIYDIRIIFQTLLD
ncbi:MAG: sugar transferase [Candidatus Limimorpha sp.]